MEYSVKNWPEFQHFKSRNPPWIKFYRRLLDDPEWHKLDGESAKVLVMVWLVASETNGTLPCLSKLAFRLRLPENRIKSILCKLSHWLISNCHQDDIKLISEGYHDDIPEGEGETQNKIKDSYSSSLEGETDNSERERDTPFIPLKGDVVFAPKTLVDFITWTWNLIPGVVPIQKITGSVRRTILARTREHSEQGWWQHYFENSIAPSDFLCGRQTDWAASLPWVCGPKNMAKVLAGNYTNNVPQLLSRKQIQGYQAGERVAARILKKAKEDQL